MDIVKNEYCSPYLMAPLSQLKNLFCAFNEKHSLDLRGCLTKSDSGSALMINDKQYGILSRTNDVGIPCNKDDVSKFKDFITNVTVLYFELFLKGSESRI